MALLGVIKSEDTTVGIGSEKAYARITGIEGDKDFIYMNIEVHASQEARFSGKDPIHKRKESLQTIEVSANIYPTLYTFLKALPFFSGWVDA